MKRRHIALLAAVSVATPVLLGGAAAPAAATGRSARPLSGPSALSVREARAMPNGDRLRGDRSVRAGLKDVPRTFEAGGDWGEFDVVLENVTQGEVSGFIVGLHGLTVFPQPGLRPSHMRVQALSGGSWTDVVLDGLGPGNVNGWVPVDGMVLSQGKTTIRMRAKFSADAPFDEFHLSAWVDTGHGADDEDTWTKSRLVRRDAPSPDPSTDPSPDPSTDPGPEPSARHRSMSRRTAPGRACATGGGPAAGRP
ncbi:hypothetical protein EF908_33580 [Streptomyces sp. WAC04770]|nr:hypothetical protein EF908_33580 [Streptomyces sp. WAC04770]